jgi:NAD(P)-dependent dehydrogenase (short-subunit alcohol dehydrogenase family)
MITKGGLNAITMSLASEYAKSHIRFNAVGSRDRMRKVVRVGVYLAASGDFYTSPSSRTQHRSFSGMYLERTSVRSIFGVASLPLGLPVMLEVTFEVNH